MKTWLLLGILWATSAWAIPVPCPTGLTTVGELTPGEPFQITGTTCGKGNGYKPACTYGFGEDDGYVWIVPRVGTYSVAIQSPTGRRLALDVRHLANGQCDQASLICRLTLGTGTQTGTYWSGNEPGTPLGIFIDAPYGGCASYVVTVTPPPLD